MNVPDDMDSAIGLDAEEVLSQDKPLSTDDIANQLHAQLARIREEASLRQESVSMGSGSQASPQLRGSTTMSTILKSPAEQIRAEKEALYERIAVQTLAEHEHSQKMKKAQRKATKNSRTRSKQNNRKQLIRVGSASNIDEGLDKIRVSDIEFV